MGATDTVRQGDLPIFQGRVYHLDLLPEELATNVIIVGDPDRVPFLADVILAEIETDHSHRGFRTITGRTRQADLRVSLVTSGIGAPSLEIVLNEIVALSEIDFHTRKRRQDITPLNVIRIGTSGALVHEMEIGALVVTDYAIGLDNTALFYDVPHPDQNCRQLEERARGALAEAGNEGTRFRGKLYPYAARANPETRVAIEKGALHLGVRCRRGITVSSACFFGGEGRNISRVPVTFSELDSALGRMESGIEGLRVLNIEMETAFLFHFLGAVGYRAGALCAVIDNRQEGSFEADFREQISSAAEVAVHAFLSLSQA